MTSLEVFFQATQSQVPHPNSSFQPVTLTEQQPSKITECRAAVGQGNSVFFIIEQQFFQVRVNVKMEPIFIESQPKQFTVQKIVLHLGQAKLQLNSSIKLFMTELYRTLKKSISHKGFNQYFKPLKRLGRGSFAAVYLIESKFTGKQLAAKVFSRQGQKLEYKGKQSLEKQISTLKLLNHPNIIQFDGIYETDNLIYMVTQYLSGGTLVEFMRNNRNNLEQHLVKIVSDILQALAYLKANKIMHRDLKPQNIVLRKDDNKWVLVDFGLAAFSNQAYLYDRCGTMGYMAPQVEAKNSSPEAYTEACDMYSLGVILYELILGFLPFKVEMENMYDRKYIWEGLTKKQCTELHPAIVDLLKGLLDFDAKKRWTPSQSQQCQFMTDPQIIQSWKAYKERINNERYEKLLKMRDRN